MFGFGAEFGRFVEQGVKEVYAFVACGLDVQKALAEVNRHGQLRKIHFRRDASVVFQGAAQILDGLTVAPHLGERAPLGVERFDKVDCSVFDAGVDLLEICRCGNLIVGQQIGLTQARAVDRRSRRLCKDMGRAIAVGIDAGETLENLQGFLKFAFGLLVFAARRVEQGHIGQQCAQNRQERLIFALGLLSELSQRSGGRGGGLFGEIRFELQGRDKLKQGGVDVVDISFVAPLAVFERYGVGFAQNLYCCGKFAPRGAVDGNRAEEVVDDVELGLIEGFAQLGQ